MKDDCKIVFPPGNKETDFKERKQDDHTIWVSSVSSSLI
jgi:hypothetical protein